MTQIEELKERIVKAEDREKELKSFLENNRMEDLDTNEDKDKLMNQIVLADRELDRIYAYLEPLKEWLKREQEIMKVIDDRIDDEEGNYNLTKTHDDLNHLNIYYRGLKKLKELKDEVEK